MPPRKRGESFIRTMKYKEGEELSKALKKAGLYPYLANTGEDQCTVSVHIRYEQQYRDFCKDLGIEII